MTTIEISRRLFTLMNRATEIYWDKLLQEAKEKTSTDEAREKHNDKEEYMKTFYELTIGKFKFKLDYSFQYNHVCYKEDVLLLAEKEDCDCDKDVGYIIGLDYEGRNLFYKRINETTLENALKIVGYIKASYQICQCGNAATKEGWCNTCYIRRHTRTEAEGGDCSVCYENEGRWVRLECKHELHLHCHDKIEPDVSHGCGRKCPLCRRVSARPNIDCYDC